MLDHGEGVSDNTLERAFKDLKEKKVIIGEQQRTPAGNTDYAVLTA